MKRVMPTVGILELLLLQSHRHRIHALGRLSLLRDCLFLFQSLFCCASAWWLPLNFFAVIFLWFLTVCVVVRDAIGWSETNGEVTQSKFNHAANLNSLLTLSIYRRVHRYYVSLTIVALPYPYLLQSLFRQASFSFWPFHLLDHHHFYHYRRPQSFIYFGCPFHGLDGRHHSEGNAGWGLPLPSEAGTLFLAL